MKDKVQKIREKVARIQLYSQSEVLKDILDYIDEVQKEPVSTKDKLLALSDGRLHLGWIDDAKVVEFEECLMQFHEDMNNIPQGTDSLTRLKDTDGVLHSYSKKLMSMAKEEPVSEELPHIRHRDTLDEFAYQCAYDLSNDWAKETPTWHDVEMACKLGAKWQKEKDESTTEDLCEYINELSKQFPEVSFAKLSRIAVRVAKWQKEQIKRAMDLGEPPYLISVEQAYYRTPKLLEE